MRNFKPGDEVFVRNKHFKNMCKIIATYEVYSVLLIPHRFSPYKISSLNSIKRIFVNIHLTWIDYLSTSEILQHSVDSFNNEDLSWQEEEEEEEEEGKEN